jgi:DNA-binding transcriptional ArsR family regulator
VIKTKEQKEKFVDDLIQTLKNPTRASIFYQLARKPESTATAISRNLGEDVDVVYYHLKHLKKAGLVSKPRVVVRKNYICKHYSLHPSFKEKFLQSIGQYKAKKKELSTDKYREILIAFSTVIQSVLASSVRRLEKVDSKIINKIRDKENIEFEIIFCSKERYDQLLGKLREIAIDGDLSTFDFIEKEHVVAIIAIPKLGENVD